MSSRKDEKGRLSVLSLLILIKLAHSSEFERAVRLIREKKFNETNIAYLLNAGLLSFSETEDGKAELHTTELGLETVSLWRNLHFDKLMRILTPPQLKKLLSTILEHSFENDDVDIMKIISTRLPINILRAFHYAFEEAIRKQDVAEKPKAS